MREDRREAAAQEDGAKSTLKMEPRRGALSTRIAQPYDFIEADSPPLGEERKSYRTAQADGRGYSAWTDLYLKGRTVVLVQVVDSSPDGQPLRQHAGSRSLQSAP